MALYSHFKQVFGQPGQIGYELDFLAIGIQPRDLSALDLPFSVEEVEVVMREMPPDRASGPDGFTGAFYKTAWPVIKDDVTTAINALFFGDSRAFDKLNNAFIVLLPKKPGARSPADYRPITMIHSFEKIASKLMANRLATRLHELISPNQNAFVKGRTIHDNFKFVQ
jgi:hypothetical protein